MSYIIEPVATCPYCGGEIPLTFDLDKPLSGIRVVTCLECGREFNMGYTIEEIFETEEPEIIITKPREMCNR